MRIRPIAPRDEPGEREFFEHLSSDTKRLRFLRLVNALSDELIHFFTHIDHDRHEAFVCEHEGRLVGEARYLANPDGRSCEFGVVVADDWHHSGIARPLMDALIGAARKHGLQTMEGLVLRENAPMLALARALGFELAPEPRDPAMVRVVKNLRSESPCHAARAWPSNT